MAASNMPLFLDVYLIVSVTSVLLYTELSLDLADSITMDHRLSILE